MSTGPGTTPEPDIGPNPGTWGGGRKADGYCHHCRDEHDNPCDNFDTCVCPCIHPETPEASTP